MRTAKPNKQASGQASRQAGSACLDQVYVGGGGARQQAGPQGAAAAGAAVQRHALPRGAARHLGLDALQRLEVLGGGKGAAQRSTACRHVDEQLGGRHSRARRCPQARKCGTRGRQQGNAGLPANAAEGAHPGRQDEGGHDRLHGILQRSRHSRKESGSATQAPTRPPHRAQARRVQAPCMWCSAPQAGALARSSATGCKQRRACSTLRLSPTSVCPLNARLARRRCSSSRCCCANEEMVALAVCSACVAGRWGLGVEGETERQLSDAD